MALSSDDVTSATVTISGPGISPALVAPLARQGDQWAGLILKIPVGTDRTFVAEAFDASGRAIYRGQATGVTITRGSTVVVAITAQQIDAPPTSHNAAPIIDAVVVSAVAIAPSETIAVDVQAHDPNAGDSLSYAWSGAGTFSAASSASTSWSAPAAEDAYSLTIAVSDPKGETASLSFSVDVHGANGKGDASVGVTINTWPSISDLSATPTRLAAAEATTSLDVAASDADGDVLSYGWSTDCSGSFSPPAAKAPTFMLSALPAGGSCTFTVTVTDGRGGTNTGTLNLPTGPEPTVNEAPQIAVASQSRTTASPGETVDLFVQASDPEGTALTFSWSASAGTLGTPASSTSMSEVVWTAPASGGSFTVSAVVQDADGAQTTQSFAISVDGCVGGGPLTIGGVSNAHGVGVNLSNNRIFVSRWTGSIVSMIDGDSGTLLGNFGAAWAGAGVAVNSITNRVYVSGWDGVSVNDATTGAPLSSFNTSGYAGGTGAVAGGIAVNTTSNRIYVAPGHGGANVLVFDGATHGHLASIGGFSGGWGIDVNPTTNRIYATSNGDSNVRVIDGTTNAVIATVAVDTTPSGVSVNPVTNRIYVANGNNVSVIDGVTSTVVATLASVCTGAANVVANASSNKIYVGCGNNTAWEIDGVTHAVSSLGAIGSGTQSDGIDVNPSTGKVYVAAMTAGNVTVFSGCVPPAQQP
jgi:YVTN family beta-propeller protein